jgi:hypothetical protein
MYKITRNKAQCLLCGEIIESKFTHDYVTCSCGNLSVDGGRSYLRRCSKLHEWVDLSEVEQDEETQETEIKN